MVQLARDRHPGSAPALFLPGVGFLTVRRPALDQGCAFGLGGACHPRIYSGLLVHAFKRVLLRSDGHVRQRQDYLALFARLRREPPVVGGGTRGQEWGWSGVPWDTIGVFAGSKDSLG